MGVAKPSVKTLASWPGGVIATGLFSYFATLISEIKVSNVDFRWLMFETFNL